MIDSQFIALCFWGTMIVALVWLFLLIQELEDFEKENKNG